MCIIENEINLSYPALYDPNSMPQEPYLVFDNIEVDEETLIEAVKKINDLLAKACGMRK